MVVAFTVTEIHSLMMSLFCDVVLPYAIFTCGIKFFDCAICLVSGIATKEAMASPKSFTKF